MCHAESMHACMSVVSTVVSISNHVSDCVSDFESRPQSGLHRVGLPAESKKIHAGNLKGLKTLEDFASYPGIAGCQTKMIVGQPCAAFYNVSLADVVEAKRRITEDFAFVGIVDYWEESVCLFHRMYGAPIHEHEFLNLRPTTSYKVRATLFLYRL
jgi:hypothetical protein